MKNLDFTTFTKTELNDFKIFIQLGDSEQVAYDTVLWSRNLPNSDEDLARGHYS